MKISKTFRPVLLVLAAACALPAHAERFCSNATLFGDYSFRITGQILTGPLAGLDNGVALVTFDGDGNITSKDHVVLNGVQPVEEWRTSSGAYTVNPDCTGRAQINFTDGRTPPIVYYFIVTSRREQLDVVVGNSGSNVSVVATKKN